MQTFEIEGPDGVVYEVEAESIEAAAQAVQSVGSDEKPWYQTLKENIVGDDDPTTQNTGEKIGSFVNKAIESMTFGLIGDEADAAVAGAIPGGQTYDERLAHNRQQEKIFERENPAAALTAEIGGGLAGAMLPMGTIGTLSRGAGLMPRLGAASLAGATGGATYGFMEGEGLDDRRRRATTGGALGAAAGAVSVPVGAGIQRVADSLAGSRAIRAATRNAPSTEALREMGEAGYRQIDDAGVQIRPQAFDGARQRVLAALRAKTGFDELPGPGSLTPNSARTMQIMGNASDEMAQDATSALPFRSLDQMRRQAGAAAGNVANKTDQAAGMEIISGLDDFVNRLSPDDVVAGDVAALKEAIPKARDLWTRLSRSQLIDDAISQQDNYVSGGASAIRNQFASILRNKRLAANFSEAEKAAMRRVVNGSLLERGLNTAGSGLGLIASTAVGATGGVPGALGGAALSSAARRGGEAITRRNAEVARALVANGTMRGGLPVATDSSRRIVESLMRRTGAVAPH